MSHPPTPYSLRELVAENLRRLRNVTSASPQDVVRAARQFGLEWTPSWYAALERGQKPLSAEHLMALPAILTSALAYRVSLSDLLLGDGPLHLGKPIEGTTLSLHYLRELVTAAPFKRSFLDFDEADSVPPDEAPAAMAAAEKMREIVRANLGDVDVRALARAEAGAGDAEAKLARKLEVAEIVVIAAAASLWGRSLTEERDDLLHPADGDPPSRTTVTRRLTNAIAQKLADAAEAAQAKAAFVAASSAVTAEFPLVQPNMRPQPVEIASGARQFKILPVQRRPAAIESRPEPAFEPDPAYEFAFAPDPEDDFAFSPDPAHLHPQDTAAAQGEAPLAGSPSAPEASLPAAEPKARPKRKARRPSRRRDEPEFGGAPESHKEPQPAIAE